MREIEEGCRVAFGALRQEVRDAWLRAKTDGRRAWTEDQGPGFWLLSNGQFGWRVAWYPEPEHGAHFLRLGATVVRRTMTASFDASPADNDVEDPFVRLWKCRGPVLHRGGS